MDGDRRRAQGVRTDLGIACHQDDRIEEARSYFEGALEMGEKEGKSLLDAMRDGTLDGMQYFDGELEKLVRAGHISPSTAYLYAIKP